MAYSAISKSSLHFNTVAWTGTSSSPLNVTGYGFQPDLIWNKYRAGAGDHQLYDAVRTATKMLIPNGTNAESTNANGVTAFITDGYTVGSDLNVNGGNSVGWGWKANGSGSSNGNGSISSTVSANTTAGISIVSYTGTGSNATVGHGLGAVPKCMWVKGTGNATAWNIYHASLGANKHLNFDSSDAEQSYSNRFNDTDPTSTVFTIGTDAETNNNGNTMVAYCFAEVSGFSSFGSYKGNGGTDGAFIYCGFKPAFVIIKNTAASQNWTMNNNKSLGYNPDNNILFPNTNGAENTGDNMDLLSNGFKIRWNDGVNNTNGQNYIYMAFAEEPFVANVGSNGIAATAR